jgi:hypothetical protein
MIESLSGLLNTALAIALGVIGWIIKRMIERLDIGDKRMTKIEVELAAQRERDIAVEARIAKVEEDQKKSKLSAGYWSCKKW